MLTTHDKMVEIADRYCSLYGITRQDLFRTNKIKNAKKRKVYNGVNISTLRMALGYYLSNNFPATLTEIALVIGYNDHSTISYNNQRIYFYIKNNDPFFMQHYKLLETIGAEYEPVKFHRFRQNYIYA
jgi:chromosomal replication initiation ATPase DnaA